ncbi:MAG: glutamine--fructose-6-phosphate transaminase (isomerizing), partial [Pseudomonadota bacterium]
TTRVSYLEEGDWAVVTRDSAQVYTAQGDPVERKIKTVLSENAYADKGTHKHYMDKEIHEQPTVVSYALSAYTSADRKSVDFSKFDLSFEGIERIVIVACGTAYLAGHVARYWFESIAKLPVEIEVASEFRYREPPVGPGTMAVFISQSGETADTLAALRYCQGKAAKILSVVNVSESSIARESDVVLPIHAGVEIGVASTKAFTCQLTVLAALTLFAARGRGTLDASGEAAHLDALDALPRAMTEALGLEADISALCWELSKASDVLFLGRGPMYPLALEGALKLKEISYIHAEGYASGELKHGPIALVDEVMPVIVMAPRDGLFDKTVSNMQEVMARGGKVLLISDAQGIAEAGDGVWASLCMPTISAFAAPILYSVPAQMLAYHTAVTKGTDVDQPRNLAKSVTVE